jgi:hypothetical protein
MPTDRGTVLIGPEGARTGVAIVQGLAALLATLGLIFFGAADGARWALFLLAVAVGGALTAVAVWQDLPLTGRRGRWLGAGVALLVGSVLLSTLLVVADALSLLQEQATTGGMSRAIAIRFVLAPVPLVWAGVVVGSVRWALPRRRVAVPLVAILLIGLGGGAVAAGVTVQHTGCDAFRFDAGTWQAAQRADGDAQDTMADAILRCHVKDRKAAAQARAYRETRDWWNGDDTTND